MSYVLHEVFGLTDNQVDEVERYGGLTEADIESDWYWINKDFIWEMEETWQQFWLFISFSLSEYSLERLKILEILRSHQDRYMNVII